MISTPAGGHRKKLNTFQMGDSAGKQPVSRVTGLLEEREKLAQFKRPNSTEDEIQGQEPRTIVRRIEVQRFRDDC